MAFEPSFTMRRLGDLVVFINGDRGKNYPKEDDFVLDGVPFISATHIASGRLEYGAGKKISRSAFDRLGNGKIRKGDLLYCLRGSVGKAAIVMDEMEGAIASSLVIIRGNELADTRYIRYVLSSDFGQILAKGLDNGSVQPNISVRDLKEAKVPAPSRSLQSDIVSILDCFDARIDLTKKENDTREAIAQALFKSWFLDFDPVSANAECVVAEGMDRKTAALFPAKFEDSTLGPIPEGWTVKPFATQFDFTMGQSPPGSTYNTEKVGVPFFQGCTDFGDVFPSERIYCSEPTRLAREGDVLLSVRAPVGSLNIATYKCSIGRGLCAVRHRSGSTALTYLSLRAHVDRIDNAAGEGALFRSLSKQQLGKLPVLAADESVVSRFIGIVEPLIDRMQRAAEQVIHLSAIRDTLLPRLISGKLRLPEAEAIIEDAVA